MKQLSLIALFLIILYFSSLFVLTTIGLEQAYNSKLTKILDLKETIIQKDQEILNAENTLKNIALSIAETDHYLHLGGSLPYDVNNLLDKIINLDLLDLSNEIEFFFDERRNFLRDIPSIFPILYENFERISSGYGTRFDAITREIRDHKGIDIVANKLFAPVIATADGVVKHHWILGDAHPIFGRMIVIEHKNGFSTMYAHLSRTYVREGMEIKKGQRIGLVGNTGISYGDHLHYEIWIDEKPVNPIHFLREYR